MKAIVACSVAAFLCLMALVRNTPAQGEGYSCYGPFQICPTFNCMVSSESCPVVPSETAQGYGEAPNMMTTTCNIGTGTCYPTQQTNACVYTYYLQKNFLNQCSNSCGTDFLVAAVCQLGG